MKLTKKQMTEAIESWLRHNEGSEVVVKEFQYELRSGRYGLKAYSIVSDDGENVWCRPWAGANVVWRIPWFRMKYQQIKSIYDKIH